MKVLIVMSERSMPIPNVGLRLPRPNRQCSSPGLYSPEGIRSARVLRPLIQPVHNVAEV